MNSWIWASIFMFLISLPNSLATTKQATHESSITFRTKLNATGAYLLKVQGTDVWVDGMKLSGTSTILGNRALAVILSGKDTLPTTLCAAGEYVHHVKGPQHTVEEKGCLTDTRFAQLQRSFETLRKIALAGQK